MKLRFVHVLTLALLSPIVIFVLVIFWFGISETSIHNFCDSLSIGDEYAAVVERANQTWFTDVSSKEHKGQEVVWVSGPISYCSVKFEIENMTVVDKFFDID